MQRGTRNGTRSNTRLESFNVELDGFHGGGMKVINLSQSDADGPRVDRTSTPKAAPALHLAA